MERLRLCTIFEHFLGSSVHVTIFSGSLNMSPEKILFSEPHLEHPHKSGGG
jgi:hypothetical protein